MIFLKIILIIIKKQENYYLYSNIYITLYELGGVIIAFSLDYNFCEKCHIKSPPCLINKIPISKKNIKNIFLDSLSKTGARKVFVCPTKAQKIDQNEKMIINQSKCLNCNLCYYLCVNNKTISNNIINITKLEKFMFNSLDYMSFILNTYSNNEITFFSEVKTKGHSRNKRIDIVAFNNNKIYLIKVINDKKNIPYYERSYIKIKGNLSINNENINIYLLTKFKTLSEINPKKSERLINLKELIKKIK